MKLKVKRVRPEAKLPLAAKGTPAGLDLYACIPKPLVLYDGIRPVIIPTGIAVEPEDGYFCLVQPRSGLSCMGILVHTGVIDPDYRGEVKVVVSNISNEPFVIKPGMRIAQLVVAPYVPVEVEEVEELSDTERGSDGLGSTGLF